MNTSTFTIVEPSQLRQIIREELSNIIQEITPSSNSSDYYLSRKEACDFLKIGATNFNAIRQEGKVNPIRLGTRTIYKKSDLLNIGAN